MSNLPVENVSASSKHRVNMSTLLSLLLVTACAVACHANADSTADNITAASHHHMRKLAGTCPQGGACGSGGNGCSCPSGQCCSQYNYCGVTSAHCGVGCQRSYGSCGSPGPISSSPSPSTSPKPEPPSSPGSGQVLYQKTASGTYYYDVRNNKCDWQTKLYPPPAGGYFDENSGYPRCTSIYPSLYKRMYQYNSNNIIAMDNNILKSNLAKYCGKKVIVTYKGKQVAAPDGGDWFVWDGCQACIGGGIVDFSLSGLQKVNSSACFYGKVPNISYKVVDTVVQKYIP